MKNRLISAACLASAMAAAGATEADQPANYTHLLPLTASTRQGVLQVRLPRDVYLHARSAMLDDVRVFDAKGTPQPFALQEPVETEEIGHQDVALKIFPLMGRENQTSQLDLDVHTAPDGRLLSVKVRPEQDRNHAASVLRLTGLLLDLGKLPSTTGVTPTVNALRFTLPEGKRDYSAQVWLETSNDMKHWDAVAAAELNWLVNQQQQTLSNDRLDFEARTFRYARLSWRSGTPLEFAAIVAEQPIRTSIAEPREQLLLKSSAGEQPQDLLYAVPPAIAALSIGLQFNETNVVLPVQLGMYRTVSASARQAGVATRRFEPVISTTFYRITQNGQTRSSGDLVVVPRHTPHWVLRSTASVPVQPLLRLGWQPATLVFLASGNAPYTLAVGNQRSPAASRPLEQVAPGFSTTELRQLERATAGAAVAQQAAPVNSSAEAADEANSTSSRLLVLWGVLMLGTGVLAAMVWRLLRSPQQPRG